MRGAHTIPVAKGCADRAGARVLLTGCASTIRRIDEGTDVEAPQLADHFEDGDWVVLIHVRWDQPERRYAGRAELLQAGTLKCRIDLSGEFELAREAAKSLRSRAKDFIEDWRRREHHADSEFSEL